MSKVFISQPMKGKTDAEISLERQRIIDGINVKYNEIIVVNSFFKGAPEHKKPVWWLSKSIELLSQADAAILCTRLGNCERLQNRARYMRRIWNQDYS